MARRRRWLVAVGGGLVLAAYLTLAALAHLASLSHLADLPPQHPGTGERAAPGEQYTLPSLQQLIRAEHDLDMQRVLRLYYAGSDHTEASAGDAGVRVVVSSTWRSGSTLLGEVLAAHPGVFYHYEPLMPHGLHQLASSTHGEVGELLRGLLGCDYSHAEDYLKFAYVNQDMFQRNRRLWSLCSAMPRSKCYQSDTLARLCSLFPVHVAKVVRARLHLLEPLLDQPRLRLVWLVRDPRAVMSSRSHSVSWCQTPACSHPGYLCADLAADLATFLTLRESHPEQVMLLRYEDFARDPYRKSREVLQFAGLDLHHRVQEYLDDHLSSDDDSPWSTRHNPRTRVSRWMKVLSYEDVVKTQYHCRAVMRDLGYRLFTAENDLETGNAVGLLNLP